MALGLTLGLAVCAPLIGTRRVFLLDWSFASHTPLLGPTLLGLNGGLVTGVVGSIGATLLNLVVGGVATWLPIFVFFPLAAVGAGRLAGRSRWSRVAAGALYAVNPFVFNRIYVGHLPLLIGYALLPYATLSAIRSPSGSRLRWLAPALWWATLTALAPHFAWIFGVVVVAVAVVVACATRRSAGRALAWLLTVVGSFTLTNAYIFLAHSSTNLPTHVGQVSLDLYRTTADPHVGLYANVLGLYGFWRTGPGPELPKDVIAGWPFIMLAILLVVVYGAWDSLRRRASPNTLPSEPQPSDVISPETCASDETVSPPRHSDPLTAPMSRRRLAAMLVIVGIAGFFLALGDQGPTGRLFLFAYQHVPFFDVMREPQKFLMLLALAYAAFFGWGVERLATADYGLKSTSTKALTALIALGLPLGYTPTIFWGLAGQIAPSSLPTAYERADTLMGTGSGSILYLPWHLYMAYPFTGGRVVANIAPTSFRRTVISGDNVQSGGVNTQSTSPRSAYIQELLASGSHTHDFGALVAPLGVKYVVLAKAVDWTSYSWLADQRDLLLIFDSTSLEVWRNLAYDGIGHRVSRVTTVTSFGKLITLARTHKIGAGAIVLSKAAPRLTSPPSRQRTRTLSDVLSRPSVTELSPVAYRLAAGPPGWVVVDVPYQRGWALNGVSARPTIEGTTLVRASGHAGLVLFTPWAAVRLGYLISGGVVTAMVLLLVVERRRRDSALR
ncbi:MAG: hypothetical protein ACYCRG_03785 [Acidimicrobiales bacterium]